MTSPQRRPVHRRPRLLPFLLTGAVIGLIIGTFLAVTGPDAPTASASQELIAVAGPGGLLGGLLGGVVYLLVERYSTRR
ncbi:hypothetical protein [Ornithinimicrobium cavernae]|uniref:hypothetical protein n=1 Tax=Ornithinimicrobium cavernae TaxID=2666047 RepID=UPI000D68CC58|nr:hypothetical protein [Ornithinimicrobium cavernae]